MLTAIVPVAPLVRVRALLGGSPRLREELSRCFAADVLSVLDRAPVVSMIVVVTDRSDLRLSGWSTSLVTVPDRALLSLDPVGEAVARGVWTAARRSGHGAVLVPADMPSLTMEGFEAAVDRLSRDRSVFVPDRSGHGSTIVAASDPRHLLGAQGRTGSAVRRRRGFRPVVEVPDGVRLDVDGPDDLALARGLGLGPRSRECLDRLLKDSPPAVLHD